MVYTFCFAPTCLGVYYLSLEVILWNNKANVAGSSLLDFYFYLNAMCVQNEACGITQPYFFHNKDLFIPPLLSTINGVQKLWVASGIDLQIPFSTNTPICFMDCVTSMYYLRMYLILRDLSSPFVSVSWLILLIVRHCFFLYCIKITSTTEGDELPYLNFHDICISTVRIVHFFVCRITYNACWQICYSLCLFRFGANVRSFGGVYTLWWPGEQCCYDV